ncbi:cyclic di-GMP phosphodiesterase [Chimaeribacter californicus]|uniref:Cyclic di-GMP phosphodiesterase n=1 Tax=Chimaeribacter californicus TaxID=2060067 RepID=A0A2N5E550_9GAMM|nr:cyclic di-GMP phosphodiesterase [Chimaeribacter californicus]PLR36261.1 cyclic di-GMP phosphodiesterase [Chimaeribacter californicus]
MIENQDGSILYQHFGTPRPYWRLHADSNALELSAEKNMTNVAVALTGYQATTIRELSGVTASFSLDISLYGTPLRLHLVGRRIGPEEWGGTASDYYDTPSVAHDLEVGLSFAEQVVSEANSVIVIVDQEGKVQRFNRLSEEYTGVKEKDVIGKSAYDLFMSLEEGTASRQNITGFFQTAQSYEVERWINTVKGQRLFLFRNKFVHSGSGKQQTFLICSGTDITDERMAQERLRILANTDTITGLANRHAIMEKMNAALTERGDQSVGVIYLDLDNFKKVNDAYGHMFGDRLLQEVATSIRACLGPQDTLARLGGDEFIILSENTTLEALEACAQQIHSRLKTPFRIGLIEVYTGCSCGLALCPEHGTNAESLIRNADTAMYVAKDQGRRTHRVFSPEMNYKVAEYMWLDTNLRKALDEHQLLLYYQPKISSGTGRVESVEALVRWYSPERGLIAPAHFIPYAEESGLIGPLGKWVMETAANQAVAWQQKGLNLRIAVNLSARQLSNNTLIPTFKEAMASSGMTRCLLDVELTESCLIEDESTAVSLIGQLQALGADVYLDDFGTGYSSLSQLARIPIDYIKLDQSFVRGISDNEVSQALVRAIIAVARTLNLKVVAEGVETENEERFVDEVGVDDKQGYFYAKPMPAEDLEHWLLNNDVLHPSK